MSDYRGPGDRISRLFEEGAEDGAGGFEHVLGGFLALADKVQASVDPNCGAVAQLEVALLQAPEPHRQRLRAAFEMAMPLCESPIEKRLLPWLLTADYGYFPRGLCVMKPGESASLPQRELALICQLPVGKYRVDFALAAKRGGPIRFVLVECDGAEFHQDAEKDAARERAIMLHPRVLGFCRVTGARIWADPAGAADDVAHAVRKLWSVKPRRTA